MFNCIVLKNKIEVNSFPRRNVLPQRGAGKSDSKFQKIFLFYFFIQAAMYGMWGSQLPGQGLNLCSLHWEHGVLTTGPPGKPRKNVFSKKKNPEYPGQRSYICLGDLQKVLEHSYLKAERDLFFSPTCPSFVS